MSDVIIFGTNSNAELAHYYLTHDSEHTIVAFTVDADYLPEQKELFDLPIIAFEELTTRYPSDSYKLFAPLNATRMNQDREKVFNHIKEMGYELISYISSHATVLSEEIGENCFILEDNTIQPYVTIGDNCILWSGNHIGHHSQIGSHVFISSHVVVSGHCTLGDNCFLGVNSTLRDGIKLAEGTLVAMATSITKNTEPWSAYIGNPAKKLNQSSLETPIYHNHE